MKTNECPIAELQSTVKKLVMASIGAALQPGELRDQNYRENKAYRRIEDECAPYLTRVSAVAEWRRAMNVTITSMNQNRDDPRQMTLSLGLLVDASDEMKELENLTYFVPHAIEDGDESDPSSGVKLPAMMMSTNELERAFKYAVEKQNDFSHRVRCLGAHRQWTKSKEIPLSDEPLADYIRRQPAELRAKLITVDLEVLAALIAAIGVRRK